MELVDSRVTAPSDVHGGGGVEAFLIDYAGEADLASFRFANPDLQIHAAEEPFEAEDESYHAGSFIIPTEGNPEGLRALLQSASEEFGFVAQGVDDTPEISHHPVESPRVAVMHTWSTTQQEGWMRIGLDEYQIPYDYISVHEARDTRDLKSQYDVIIIGPGVSNAISAINGVQGDDPIPWKSTEITPNLGRQDETDDMRGGLELSGVMHLQNFVEAGGVLITVGNSSILPVHFGLTEGVSIKTTSELWAPGGVFRAKLTDLDSPLTYGYGDELGVYFNRAPVFAMGGGGGGFRRGGSSEMIPSTDGSTTARRTGRGDVNNPDIVQGRSVDMGKAGVEAFREAQRLKEEAEEEEAEGADESDASSAEPDTSPRVVARFPSESTDLLISGGLVAGSEMTNAPAVIDVPRGDGHIIMFSFNPFWRGETLGSYAMVLNALLHHESLGVGR